MMIWQNIPSSLAVNTYVMSEIVFLSCLDI